MFCHFFSPFSLQVACHLCAYRCGTPLREAQREARANLTITLIFHRTITQNTIFVERIARILRYRTATAAAANNTTFDRIRPCRLPIARNRDISGFCSTPPLPSTVIVVMTSATWRNTKVSCVSTGRDTAGSKIGFYHAARRQTPFRLPSDCPLWFTPLAPTSACGPSFRLRS